MIKAMIRFLRTGSFNFVPPKVKMGNDVYIAHDVFLDNIADGALITIGDGSTITRGVSILVHDASSNRRIGMTYVAPVNIGKRVFVGYNSVILPGVSVGDDAVIGAGSVVTKDVAAGTVVAGVPAVKIGETGDLDRRRIALSERSDIFSYDRYERDHPLEEKVVAELVESAAKNGHLFIGK